MPLRAFDRVVADLQRIGAAPAAAPPAAAAAGARGRHRRRAASGAAAPGRAAALRAAGAPGYTAPAGVPSPPPMTESIWLTMLMPSALSATRSGISASRLPACPSRWPRSMW